MPETQKTSTSNPITPEVFDENVLDTSNLVDRAFLSENEEDDVKDRGEDYRNKFSIRVKIGDVVLSNLQGDFIGRFVLRKETRQYPNAEFIIKDREGDVMRHALDSDSIEIELGFVGGKKVNTFVGKYFSVGRRGPDGTIFRVIDSSKSLESSTSGAHSATESPRSPVKTKENPEDLAEKLEAKEQELETAKEKLQEAEDSNDSEEVEKRKEAIADLQTEVEELKTKIQDLQTESQVSDSSDGENDSRPSSKRTESSEADTQEIADESQFSLHPDSGFSEVVRQMDWISQQLRSAEAQEYELLSQYMGNARGSDGKPLKFVQDTNFSTSIKGSVFLQTGIMSAAKKKASEQGDEIVSRGNTVRQVAPGKEQDSGLVLSYKDHRYAFMGVPEFVKRSPIRKDSGYGSVTVRGYSVADKDNVGATVVSQPGIPKASGDIEVPEWGEISLDSPIVDGSPYTWSDATRGGQRVPESSSIMEGIVQIADLLTKLTKKSGKSKFDITSWYRDPASNRKAGGSSGSKHMEGHAVDFGYVGGDPTCVELFKDLDANHDGGVAAHPSLFSSNGRSGFVHIDLGSKRRWSY